MAVQATDPAEPPFDCVLASTLFPAALRLAHLATHPRDAAEPAATLEQLSEQAASLKANLARLSEQADQLPAAQLSLEDQDWLIQQLEARVEQSRQALVKMSELTRFDPDDGRPAGPADDTTTAAASAVERENAGASAPAPAGLKPDQMDTAA
ncbi:hypothetical protein JCM3774_006045 [Rhodotorula dairenensis]